MGTLSNWLLLFLAILFETGGTVSMKLSHGFTRTGPIITMFISYGIGLTLMTIVLRRLDISIVYAIWSGLGTVLIALVGIFWFKEPASVVKLLSILLIIIGVVGLNLSSQN